MTILDAIFIFVAAALGFILGSVLTAASYADDCTECRKQQLIEDCKAGNCLDCKYYSGTVEYGECKLTNSITNADEYCLEWEAKEDVQV